MPQPPWVDADPNSPYARKIAEDKANEEREKKNKEESLGFDKLMGENDKLKDRFVHNHIKKHLLSLK